MKLVRCIDLLAFFHSGIRWKDQLSDRTNFSGQTQFLKFLKAKSIANFVCGWSHVEFQCNLATLKIRNFQKLIMHLFLASQKVAFLQ